MTGAKQQRHSTRIKIALAASVVISYAAASLSASYSRIYVNDVVDIGDIGILRPPNASSALDAAAVHDAAAVGPSRPDEANATAPSATLGVDKLPRPHLSLLSPPARPSYGPLARLSFAGVSPCYDVNEAYGAAFLVSSSFLVGRNVATAGSLDAIKSDPSTFSVGHNATIPPDTNMEGASFKLFSAPATRESGLKSRPDIRRTVDAFEFMVEHLSIYERKLQLKQLVEKGSGLVGDVTRIVTAVMRAREASLAEEMAAEADRARGVAKSASNESNFGDYEGGERVIAVMPFYGVGRGSGNSIPETRSAYLSMCYRSVSRAFPHVAVVVSNEDDRAYLLERSGLLFFEVILIEGLDSPSYLGLATVFEMQRKFVSGEWSHKFDFAYFTESDQVLHLRPHQVSALLSIVQSGDKILVPHRFLPFPHPSDFENDPRDKRAMSQLRAEVKRARQVLDGMATKPVENITDPSRYRCCFDRETCRHRERWVDFFGDARKGYHRPPMSASDVRLLRIGGDRAAFALINGPSNQFKMTVRTCAVQKGGEKCLPR